MISYLTGTIYNKDQQSITVLTTGGVGYSVKVTPAMYVDLIIDSEVALYTYLAVRENALELYGFKNLPERDLFLKFLTISGVGPKSALHLLSLGSVEETSSAISRGDAAYLSKVSGVGKKTAERIVVELKSKMGDFTNAVEDKNGESLGDVVDALVSLGYSKEEARLVVKSLDAEGKTSEQLVKEALRSVGK
jgi:holliday junction DNA helicase RuvA